MKKQANSKIQSTHCLSHLKFCWFEFISKIIFLGISNIKRLKSLDLLGILSWSSLWCFALRLSKLSLVRPLQWVLQSEQAGVPILEAMLSPDLRGWQFLSATWPGAPPSDSDMLLSQTFFQGLPGIEDCHPSDNFLRFWEISLRFWEILFIDCSFYWLFPAVQKEGEEGASL